MSSRDQRYVSSYVLEILGLNEGDQDSLLAVKFFRFRGHGDEVITVGRALKHIRLNGFVKKFKLCLDEADGVVYIKANAADLVSSFRSYKVRVGFHSVCLEQVTNIVQRKDSHTDFFNIPVRIKVWFFMFI